MTSRQQLGSKNGFTRTELLVIIGILLLLVVVVLVAAPRLRAKHKLSRCEDNLKNVTLAFILWGEDNDTIKPLWRVPVEEKGTLGFEPASRRSEAWFQFMTLSNQLVYPRYLVDPADEGTRPATTWDLNPATGFAAPQFQDRACSYAVSLDFRHIHSGPPPIAPFGEFLFLDRHLGPKHYIEQCSLGFSATAVVQPFNPAWSKKLHGDKRGNVSRPDCSVEAMSAQRFRDLLPANADYDTPGRSAHFLFPKRQGQ